MASLEGGFVGADSDAGPVGGLDGVGPGVSVFDEGADEFVDEVRVRASVSAALDEGEVSGIVDFGGHGELADRLGEEMSEIGDGDLFGDFGFGFLCGVEDVGFVFDEGPLETFLRAVDIEAFAVLSGGVVEESPDVAGDIGVLDMDVAGLDGELVAGFLLNVFADGA